MAKYALVIVLAFSFQGCGHGPYGQGPYFDIDGKTYNCEEWHGLQKLKRLQRISGVNKNSLYVGGKALVLIPPRDMLKEEVFSAMTTGMSKRMSGLDRDINCFVNEFENIKFFYVDVVKKGQFFDSVVTGREFSAIQSEKPDYVIYLRKTTGVGEQPGYSQLGYVWYPANNEKNKIALFEDNSKKTDADRYNSFNDSLSKALILLGATADPK